MPLSEKSREILLSKGRKDLVDIMDINDSGYAGVNSNGTIVDRRIHPDAIPVMKNTLLGLPASKDLPKCFQCHYDLSLENDGICLNEGTPQEMFQCNDCHFMEHGVNIMGGSLYFHKLFKK